MICLFSEAAKDMTCRLACLELLSCELLSPSVAGTASKYNKADRLLRAGCSAVQHTAKHSMASMEYKLCKQIRESVQSFTLP
jgi:hypothetical protein